MAIVTRGRVVYEGSLDELIASTAGRYDLRTTDDGPAAVIARRARRDHRRRHDHARGSRFAGDERAVAALTLELAQAGIGLRALVPRSATLEELFFRHDRRRARAAAAPSCRRCRHDRDRRPRAHAAAPVSASSTSWELRKLRRAEAHLHRARLRAARPADLHHRAAGRRGGPEGIPFGDYVRESGLAIPLVGLFFGAFWFFPLITALVAGDIVATEDNNGTLKTILTRSVDRWQIFVGKVLAALTYAFAALVLYVGVGLFFGGIFWGFDPLLSLSGNLIAVDRALLLLGGTALVYFLPTIAIASLAILLSTVTRNSAAAVVGDADALADHAAARRSSPRSTSCARTCCPTQFNAWQGLLREPIDWAPIVRAAWVSALYAVPCACLGVHLLSAPRRFRRLRTYREVSSSLCHGTSPPLI